MQETEENSRRDVKLERYANLSPKNRAKKVQETEENSRRDGKLEQYAKLSPKNRRYPEETCPRKRSLTKESAKRCAVVGARNGDLARNRNREPVFRIYNKS